MCNYQPALRYSAILIQVAMVSYHSSFVIQLLTLHQGFYLACLLFHNQWNINAVIVIIKHQYLVYLPTCFGVNFWLAAEVNLTWCWSNYVKLYKFHLISICTNWFCWFYHWKEPTLLDCWATAIIISNVRVCNVKFRLSVFCYKQIFRIIDHCTYAFIELQYPLMWQLGGLLSQLVPNHQFPIYVYSR